MSSSHKVKPVLSPKAALRCFHLSACWCVKCHEFMTCQQKSLVHTGCEFGTDETSFSTTLVLKQSACLTRAVTHSAHHTEGEWWFIVAEWTFCCWICVDRDRVGHSCLLSELYWFILCCCLLNVSKCTAEFCWGVWVECGSRSLQWFI